MTATPLPLRASHNRTISVDLYRVERCYVWWCLKVRPDTATQAAAPGAALSFYDAVVAPSAQNNLDIRLPPVAPKPAMVTGKRGFQNAFI